MGDKEIYNRKRKKFYNNVHYKTVHYVQYLSVSFCFIETGSDIAKMYDLMIKNLCFTDHDILSDICTLSLTVLCFS